MNHCECKECKRDYELLEQVREIMPLLMAVARAQAMASTTIANKWRDMEGETKFRKSVQKEKSVVKSNLDN